MSLFGYAYANQMISSGNVIPGVSGFNIEIRDTLVNIRARSGDDVGTIVYDTTNNRIYVYDGVDWRGFHPN